MITRMFGCLPDGAVDGCCARATSDGTPDASADAAASAVPDKRIARRFIPSFDFWIWLFESSAESSPGFIMLLLSNDALNQNDLSKCRSSERYGARSWRRELLFQSSADQRHGMCEDAQTLPAVTLGWVCDLHDDRRSELKRFSRSGEHLQIRRVCSGSRCPGFRNSVEDELEKWTGAHDACVRSHLSICTDLCRPGLRFMAARRAPC